jgi:squalene synthase HpnC
VTSISSEFAEARDFIRRPDMMDRIWPQGEAEAYTRRLATGHYENFTVVSIFLPAELRQDFYNVYAFCRWADDLGDELGDTSESLRMLAWWRAELEAMYAGQPPRHPVFVALAPTVDKRRLPIKPFADLITAFELDQTITRHADRAAVLRYCECSANPVGRLVLMLGGYFDEERFRLSDATCTGLQLANFWQDVSVDIEKDRIYLPQDLLTRHGVSEDDLRHRRATPAFVACMREAVAWAQEFFVTGLALPPTLNRRLAIDVELFNQGGLRILEKIKAQNYDVLRQRPKVSKTEGVRLLLSAALRHAWRRSA